MISSLSLLVTTSLYLLTVVDAAPSTPAKRQSDNGACQQLTTNCVNTVDKSLNNVFAIESCVLAATCFNGQRPVDNFLAFVSTAKNGNGVPPPQSVNLPRVSSAVMNSISTNAKFISRQNFIDAFYGQLSATNGPWPSSADIVISFFDRVTVWTTFCAGDVPFRNFQDYYQFSATVSSPGCGPTTSTVSSVTMSGTVTASPIPSITSTITLGQPSTITLSTVSPSTISQSVTVTPSTVAPSGTAITSTVVPSDPATSGSVSSSTIGLPSSTLVPSGTASTSTIVPSGTAPSSPITSLPGTATSSTLVPSGTASTSTVIPSGTATSSPITSLPGTVTPSTIATSSAVTSVPGTVTSSAIPTSSPVTSLPGTVTSSIIITSSSATSVPGTVTSSVVPTSSPVTSLPGTVTSSTIPTSGPITSLPGTVTASTIAPSGSVTSSSIGLPGTSSSIASSGPIPSSSVPSTTVTNLPSTSTSSTPFPTGTPPLVSSDATCQQMYNTCITQVNSAVTNLWSIKACVLGAVCADGAHPVGAFVSAVQSWKGSPATLPVNQPRVSTALFKAGSTDGKTWSQQNFIDAYYSQLSSTNGPFPPNANMVIAYFERIAAWTGFCGKAIPYLNFADYFQWSVTVNGPTTTC